MHQHLNVSRQQRAWQALLCLVLIAFPVAVLAHPTRTLRLVLSYPPSSLRSYLTVIPPPPLRFLEPNLPADPAVLPLADPPPPPTIPATLIEPAVPAPAAIEPPTPEIAPVAKPDSPHTTPAPAQGPALIIPDNTRPPVRIEDFMPFFEPPSDSTGPATRSPETLPPSSATYRQQ